MARQALIIAGSLILLLCRAISKGNFSECENLIEQGAYVDGRDENGDSPLMTAARSPKNGKLTRMLVKSGAAVNGTNALGKPL